MPDAEAAPAPVVAPAAATETATPAVETAPAPNKTTEPPKKGKARHAEIRASLAKATATETPPEAPAPAGDTPAPEPVKPPEPEKKPAVGAVMRLTAENTKLKNRLEELETAAKKSDGESLASLREKVKKDPAILLDTFGLDLSDDVNEQLTKLNDAVLARHDPEHAKTREVLSEVEALKKKLADADKERATFAQREVEEKRRAHASKALTEGFKSDDGQVVIDPAKFPYVNHLTKAGEVDVHRGIAQATREMVLEFKKAQDRDPSDTEIHGMLAIAAEQAETYFSKRAKNWQLPQAAQPAPPVERKTPTTIGSALGGRDPGGIDLKKLSPRERHALIRENLRKATQQPAN